MKQTTFDSSKVFVFKWKGLTLAFGFDMETFWKSMHPKITCKLKLGSHDGYGYGSKFETLNNQGNLVMFVVTLF